LSNSGSESSLSPIRRSWNTDDLALDSNSLSSVFSLCSKPNQSPNQQVHSASGNAARLETQLPTFRMASERERETRCSSPLRFLPSTSNFRRDQMASNGLLRSAAAAPRAFMATLTGAFFPLFFPLLFFSAAAAAAMGFVFAMAGAENC
jgi:hypothetical protein